MSVLITNKYVILNGYQTKRHWRTQLQMNPFDAKIRTIDWMDADKCVLSFDGFDSHHNSLQLAKNSVAIGESTGAAI